MPIDPLIEYLEQTIEEAEKNYFVLAQTNAMYSKIVNAPKEELPLLINQDEDFFKEMVSARLRGEKIDTPKYTHYILWDLEISTYTMRELALLDGKMYVCSEIATRYGYNDISKRAQNCIYYD